MIRYIVPSRGRPANIRRLWEAWQETETADDTQLIVIIDLDDPKLEEYEKDHARLGTRYALIEVAPMGNIGPILNEFAPRLAQHGFMDDISADAIGFMGDDHVPRTMRWDAGLLAALRAQGRPGIVYGNDLLMGASLPTAVLIDGEIIRKLGWMVPPELRHMYLDNFWRDLGTALGAVTYVPNIVIEHMHFISGKSEKDDSYARTNTDEMHQTDHAAYERFIGGGGIERCVKLIRG